MRYIGNKESLTKSILDLLNSKGLLQKGFTFCDGFCGTGAVSNSVKQYYNKIILNDNLIWATTYSLGRIVANKCTFAKLGFNPIDFLNKSDRKVIGFFSKNYCPEFTKRMYFTSENASRIDFFRKQIEIWKNEKQIDSKEYNYLLACLVESVSLVSNTAGVYGAFLKKWDSRALKPIRFVDLNDKKPFSGDVEIVNGKLEDIVGEIPCDVLYLDPPYTQNQYGTQYHLLETLVLDDNPTISTITGSRSTAPLRSDWSKKYKANIAFDKILANTQAKYVVLSYNNDGFMSPEFIESSMKRYGVVSSFQCIKIPYKKYENWKSSNGKNHFEFLFFIKMKEKDKIFYESPLNYIGSKSKIMSRLFACFPNNYHRFIDAYGGGFNVGINSKSNSVVYNDINFIVTSLINSFRNLDTYSFLRYVDLAINKFGLERGNKNNYQKARSYYNSLPVDKRDSRFLFVLIMFGYQQQIRFNSSYEFNNPVGMRYFNDKVLEKLISFSRKIKELNVTFLSKDFPVIIDKLVSTDFVYLDPPYFLTTGSYNDGKRGFKGWTKKEEMNLIKAIDELDVKHIRFALSYVAEHNGFKNDTFLTWVKEKKYHIIAISSVLGISGSRRNEVLITNYVL